MTTEATISPRLFTFTQRAPAWFSRRERIERTRDFYEHCWNCGHRCGHHDDYVFNSRCRLCDCNIR
jgi:hypothetical protein